MRNDNQQSLGLSDSSFCRLARAHAKRLRWRMARLEYARDLFGQPFEVAVFLDEEGREVRRTADQIEWAASE